MIDTKKCDLIENRLLNGSSMTKCVTVSSVVGCKQLARLASVAGLPELYSSVRKIEFEVVTKRIYTYVSIIVTWGEFSTHQTAWDLSASQIVAFLSEYNRIREKGWIGEL